MATPVIRGPGNNAALWILIQRQWWLQSLRFQSRGRGAGREQRTCSGLEQLSLQIGAQEPGEPCQGSWWEGDYSSAQDHARADACIALLSLSIQMTL